MIAAFSYGNGIPLRLLTRFVTLCNPLWTHNSSLQLYTLYHLWKVEAYTLHHAMYYDIGRKKLCWINGDNHPQHEPTTNGEEAAAAGITLGFECTEHDEVIITKLNELQDEEFMFDLFHWCTQRNNKRLCLMLFYFSYDISTMLHHVTYATTLDQSRVVTSRGVRRLPKTH